MLSVLLSAAVLEASLIRSVDPDQEPLFAFFAGTLRLYSRKDALWPQSLLLFYGY